MKDHENLRRLGQISALLHASKMNVLRGAAQARQDSLDQLAALENHAPRVDIPAIAALQVALHYRVWADQRRGEVNLELARRTADWHRARQDAAQAFGRDQVVQRLAKLPRKP